MCLVFHRRAILEGWSDMHWIIDGRQVSMADAGQALEQVAQRAMVEALRDELHARFGRIRHPRTGESPTVVVEGDSPDRMRVRIEGSPELLSQVAQTLERERWLPGVADSTTPPKVFLGFASEDRAISDRVATALHAAGVEVVFYAPWDLRAGDSIPAAISDGLAACTHFVTLWTPQSREKPWVLQEMYAAFMRYVRGSTRLTILRYQAGADTIPVIASDLLSPELRLDAFDEDLATFIRDMQGVSRRPAPVQAPPAVVMDERYTAAALAVARVFVDASETGRWGDPILEATELQDRTGLSATEIEDATHELSAFLQDLRQKRYAPSNAFFSEFDARWRAWDPAADGRRIAADLVNAGEDAVASDTLLARYNWSARRLNPAISYLATRRLVSISEGISHPLVTPWLRTTPDTRRFVKSRSGL